MLKHILFVIFIVVCYFLWDMRPIRHDPGILVEESPSYSELSRPQSFETENYLLKPRVSVTGEARVVSIKRYWFDDRAGLSPYGLVFGWGEMSDESYLSRLLISQSKRNYQVKMASPPLPPREINSMLLITQAIPANDDILATMKRIRRGHIVTFSGYFVDAETDHGFIWQSQITNGVPKQDGLQLFWIENLEIN